MFCSKNIIGKRHQLKRSFSEPMTIGLVSVAIIAACVPAWNYKISNANQYLIKTGVGIEKISISKNGIVWPFQKFKFVDMRPNNYEFTLHAMSNEKVPFLLPGFFTIGPKNDIIELEKYALLIENATQEMSKIISGILDGETRTLAATMTMEDIFNNRQKFKEIIIEGVQGELDKFGLMIYNANIKELEDGPDSQYFYNMRQKKASEVENEAKINIAEANQRGNIGEKEREAITRQRVAKLEADTISLENLTKKEMQVSNVDLSVLTSETDQRAKIAMIESDSYSRIREQELLKMIEDARFISENAKTKAELLPKVINESEGIRIKSDADLYAKEREANGIKAVYEAQANGVDKVLLAFNNDINAMMHFFMLNTQQYEKLAHANADAVKGMQPKITMYNMNGVNSENNPIGEICKMLPMTLGMLSDQMGLKKSGNTNNKE